MPRDICHIVTCEHGGNLIPCEFAAAFDRKDTQSWLKSHRGYDPGAHVAAQQVAAALNVNLIVSLTTRLLVDLNRSLDNDSLFSKFTRNLPEDHKQRILDQYYHSYHESVRTATQSMVDVGKTAIHLSIHTFTPRIAGTWRPIDIGLLFDPQARPEADYCDEWQRRIAATCPKLRVRMNEPYAGIDDGLTTMLRKEFPPAQYFGIEIEINNRFFKQSQERQAAVVGALLESIPSAGGLLKKNRI